MDKHRARLRAVWATVALLALILTPIPAEAGKGKWGFGDARYITLNRICRDGLEFSAVKIPAADTNPIAVNVAARLFTTTGLPDADPTNTGTYRPFESYGSLLAPTAIYSMTNHAQTLPADINNNGIVDPVNEQFHVYLDGGQLLWPRDLPVGSKVVMYAGSGVRNSDLVEDCYLNRATVAEGQALTVDAAHLSAGFGLIPPGEVVYRVTSLPAHGTLALDGSPLGQGGLFTQDDVNQNRLTYTHDGGSAMTDAFGYTVAGTTRVSVNSGEQEATGGSSSDPAMTWDASRIAFESTATNLTAGADANGVTADIFVRDLALGQTTLASVSTGGTQGDDDSINPAISPDGNAVAFESLATNLGQANSSGTCLVFQGTDAARDVYIRLGTTSTQLASRSRYSFGKCYRGNGNSSAPAVSNFGTEVAFATLATNLMQYVDNQSQVGGTADTNAVQDIYRTQGDFTENYSMPNGQSAYGGTQATGASSAPAISSDGAAVAFQSTAANLTTSDADTVTDVFVRFNVTDTALISRATGGAKGNDDSASPSISAEGRYVAFYSLATNLLAGGADNNTCFSFTAPGQCPDVFVRDRDSDGDGVMDEAGAVSTTRASLTEAGAQSTGSSYGPALSAYGRYVAFYSYSGNLVGDDTNACTILFTTYSNGQCPDVFLRDRQAGTTVRVSVSSSGDQGNSYSFNPAISADGDFVAFDSFASSLVSDDANGATDVFLRYVGYSSSFPVAITLVPVTGNPVYLPLIQRGP